MESRALDRVTAFTGAAVAIALTLLVLPVPTAVLTFEAEGDSAATMLYLSNLLFVALMGLALTAWLFFHPALLGSAETATTMRRHLRRGALVCGVMAVVTVLALPLGPGALLLRAVLPVGKAAARGIRSWAKPGIPVRRRS